MIKRMIRADIYTIGSELEVLRIGGPPKDINWIKYICDSDGRHGDSNGRGDSDGHGDADSRHDSRPSSARYRDAAAMNLAEWWKRNDECGLMNIYIYININN